MLSSNLLEVCICKSVDLTPRVCENDDYSSLVVFKCVCVCVCVCGCVSLFVFVCKANDGVVCVKAAV